ncbi:hypothetical protein EB796_025187 [Bugula neritina]|uniref:BTB domain-containing protein n=1 Tax=Bugula neritina TaxID=10212 RepID=A0A7J7ISX7_BUGNE|nr:hypothetical protein EB796_025187 [Bugula neritina]
MEYSESEESCWSISDEYRCEYAGTIIVSAASEKYDSPEEGVTSVVLVVEGKKLHYTRELLAMASQVFKALLCKETGLYQEEVELPEKKYQSVVWMLDYLNPRIRFSMSDEKAVALLPLADEYKMELLKEDCESMLLKVPPRLELVTLAHKYNLENLLRHAKQQSVTSLSHTQLEKQRKLPENKNVDLEIYIEILCKKLDKYASVGAQPAAAAPSKWWIVWWYKPCPNGCKFWCRRPTK